MEIATPKEIFRFLNLPAELRCKIYQYLLSTKYTKVELTYHRRGPGVSLFVSDVTTPHPLCQLQDTNTFQCFSLVYLRTNLLISTAFTPISCTQTDKYTLRLPIFSMVKISLSLLRIPTLILSMILRISSLWQEVIMLENSSGTPWRYT